MDGEIKLTRATIPILSRHHGRKLYVEAKSPSTETPDGPPVHQDTDNVNRPHTVKLARFVIVPHMSQVAVPVRTEASGLVFLEPKHSVLALHNVRTANGVAEVKGKSPFKIVVSNFSEQPHMLHKGMAIGYALETQRGYTVSKMRAVGLSKPCGTFHSFGRTTLHVEWKNVTSSHYRNRSQTIGRIPLTCPK